MPRGMQIAQRSPYFGRQYNPQHYIKLSWSDLVAGTVTLPSGGYDHFQIQYWTEAKNVPVEGSGEHQKYKNEVTVKPQDGTGKTATAEPQLGTDAVELKKTCTSPASCSPSSRSEPSAWPSWAQDRKSVV